MNHPTLDLVNSPYDLKQLSYEQLAQLTVELRQYILHSVSASGGHLSSNLGVVELSVALHKVFNTPVDQLIWDVGHQSYAHKILTGRKNQMSSLRKLDGMSGFPMRSESKYDSFGTAHSSTSISAALGMAIAAKIKGEDYYSIAVIGDGAMSAGMAFEALNNAGVEKDIRLLVILNDNDMSISPAVGALNSYLSQIMTGEFFEATRRVGKEVLSKAPPLFELAKKIKQTSKGLLTPATLFESFGFNYIGPIDGHDLPALLGTLENIKHLSGPQFLHIITKKGNGYKLAEEDPVAYHGPASFDLNIGVQKQVSKKTFSEIFGEWLCDTAKQDKKLVAITPAMREGSGMVKFHQQYPQQYFDVGIAEQHAVTFAAGLATQGLKPVVAIYSTFLQRAYDQLIHDVALQKLPVVFAVDRAGVVGADGATHNGVFDVAFARCIPNLSIACPSDENECRKLLTTAYNCNHPVIVRYPRGSSIGATVDKELTGLPYAKANLVHKGNKLAFLVFGTLLHSILPLAKKMNATIIDMRWIKPLDEQLLQQVAQQHQYLVSIEESYHVGAAGTAVAEFLLENKLNHDLLIIGLKDGFIEHGDVPSLLERQGLGINSILNKITQRWPELKLDK